MPHNAVAFKSAHHAPLITLTDEYGFIDAKRVSQFFGPLPSGVLKIKEPSGRGLGIYILPKGACNVALKHLQKLTCRSGNEKQPFVVLTRPPKGACAAVA